MLNDCDSKNQLCVSIIKIREGGKIITVKFILGHKLYLGEYIYIDPKSDLGGTNIN
jgi:hypothetical protein